MQVDEEDVVEVDRIRKVEDYEVDHVYIWLGLILYYGKETYVDREGQVVLEEKIIFAD